MATPKWNSDRLKVVVKGLGGKKVLVIGDVGVDRYVTGKVERISPEAPVPIVNVTREFLKLGLAANVADNVCALSSKADLVGVIGEDRGAQDLTNLLKEAKISVAGLVKDGRIRTTLKERILGENQQLLRIDYETARTVHAVTERIILNRVQKLIRHCDVVILEDYAKGFFTPGLFRDIFTAAKNAKKWVAVDPNGKTPLSWYRFGEGTLFKPNLKEAEQLTGLKIKDEATLKVAGSDLLKKTGASSVVITRGKDGMAIFQKGSRGVVHVPTFVREVYDVSGAGDTVISVLALALAAGASTEDAAIVANLAAGVEVSKRGTATVSQDEILSSMEFFFRGK